MKLKILSSILISFVFLMLSVILIVLASYTKDIKMMYVGITFLIVACIGYSVLIILGIRYWLKLKTEVK